MNDNLILVIHSRGVYNLMGIDLGAKSVFHCSV